MHKKLVAANWKMNLLHEDVKQLAPKIHSFQEQIKMNCEVQIYVPSIYIDFILNNSQLSVGAQNVHWENKGAFTGEVSASQLNSIGCKNVLIGHSERREIFKEDNTIIERKLLNAIENDLNILLCFGEPFEIREKKKHLEYISNQIQLALRKIKKEKIHKLTLAYEPIWAIGSGLTATKDQIEEMHNHIRYELVKQFSSFGDEVRILYGGSCNDTNAREIFACSNVDGGLIGGASLNFDKFSKIIEIANDLS